jgi:hypothetical protein
MDSQGAALKGGQRPIHIQRWAPSDFVNDPAVRLALSEGNYRALAFYVLVLNHSFMEGGDLPSNVPALAAVIGMPRKDVEEALPYWIEQNKLQIEETCLFNPRVRAEVFSELAYRKKQQRAGVRGGRPKGSLRVAKGKPKGSLLENQTPPAPSSAPAPTTTTGSKGIRIPPCESDPLNIAIVGACREIGTLTDKDESEVLKAFSMFPGKTGPVWITNLDTASEAWRLRAHQDLQAELSRLKAPPVEEEPDTVAGLSTRGPWEQ